MLDKLARNGEIFTVDDPKKASGAKDEVVWVMLSRLEREGWIERLERGKYMIIPLGGKKGGYTVNEYIVASNLVDPYCISYWSALNYHGLTDQIPQTVLVQTTSRTKKRITNILGIDFQIVTLTQNKFFGIGKHWIEGKKISITNAEKTTVDCLDKLQYCGGILEVAKALQTGDFNKIKLVEFSKMINNSGVMRRLGYLNDILDLGLEIPRIDTRNYLYLDPTMPHTGEKDSKWRLIINNTELEEII